MGPWHGSSLRVLLVALYFVFEASLGDIICVHMYDLSE